MPLHASPIEFNSSIQSNQRKEKFLLAVDMVVTKTHKCKKACSPMNCTLLLIVYYVSSFRHYFTSSKLSTTDYQRLTETLIQIRNAISILNVINQQISRSIRVMLFLFFFVLFSLFLSFVGAKVQIILLTYKFYGVNTGFIPIFKHHLYYKLIQSMASFTPLFLKCFAADASFMLRIHCSINGFIFGFEFDSSTIFSSMTF